MKLIQIRKGYKFKLISFLMNIQVVGIWNFSERFAKLLKLNVIPGSHQYTVYFIKYTLKKIASILKSTFLPMKATWIGLKRWWNLKWVESHSTKVK